MKRVAALIIGLVGTISVHAVSPGLVVRPIWRDGRVLVSFEWIDGLTREVRDAIRSGLPTTFAYQVDVKRGTSAWFNRTIASTTLTASVQFNNLTRRYQLSRAVDGRLEDTSQTEDHDAMERWLTRFDRVPVVNTTVLEANGEYEVSVRVQKTPRNAWVSAALGTERDAGQCEVHVSAIG